MNIFALTKLAEARQQAAIAAAETVSPNSTEFYPLCEKLEELYCAPVYKYADLIAEGVSHKDAKLQAGL